MTNIWGVGVVLEWLSMRPSLCQPSVVADEFGQRGWITGIQNQIGVVRGLGILCCWF